MPPVIYATAWLTNNRSFLVPAAPAFCESNFFAAKFENVTPRMLTLEKIRFVRKNSPGGKLVLRCEKVE